MIRGRAVLCDRNKAVIILARNKPRFRLKTVTSLPEFAGCNRPNTHKYLMRLRDKDILQTIKTPSGTNFWALSDRLEKHVPAIYRGKK